MVTFNELTLFHGGNDVGIGSRHTVFRALERVCLESDRFCVCNRSDSGSTEYVSRLLFTRLLQFIIEFGFHMLLYEELYRLEGVTSLTL